MGAKFAVRGNHNMYCTKGMYSNKKRSIVHVEKNVLCVCECVRVELKQLFESVQEN